MVIATWILVTCLASGRETVQAYTTFQTVCSIPENETNFVSSPDTRGTLGILWSCLFTIVACTWSILHLNVPEQRDGRDAGWKGDIKWKAKRLWSGFKWMLITMFAPELILGKAFGDLMAARKLSREIGPYAEADGVPWSTTHSYYAALGGFVVRSSTNPTHMRHSAAAGILFGNPRLNLNAGRDYSVPQSPAIWHTRTTRPVESRQHNIIAHVFPRVLLRMRRDGELERLPYLSEDEIQDKSESDVFSKVIAIVQVSWIGIELITRAAKGLSISQLEVATAAFAVCAVFTYLLSLEKPKGVKTPTTLMIYAGSIRYYEKGLGFFEAHRFIDIDAATILDTMFSKGRGAVNYVTMSLPNDYTDRDQQLLTLLGVAFGTLLFGGIHIAAWKFSFPSHADQLLWRTASIASTALVPTILICRAMERLLHWPAPTAHYWHYTIWAVYKFLGFLYVLSRLILLVEVFRTLCFLPPDTYVSTFAASIPHIG